MTERHIFKIVIFTHDKSLYDKLKNGIFGIDFEKSFTETSGSAFAFSHFNLGRRLQQNTRVTAQFWCLDASPQWTMIRNIYMKGSSGIIILLDPRKKGATELTNRLLREFKSVNRYEVPIAILSTKDGKKFSKATIDYAQEVERWSGFQIPHLDMDENTKTTQEELIQFMERVRDWRAFNVVSQTLKLYFDLDGISTKSRSIAKIRTQLRKIYTSRYYQLIDDETLEKIIANIAESEGYCLSKDCQIIQYTKDKVYHPFFKASKSKITKRKIQKPNVKKV